MNDMKSSERWIIGALLTVALLTFFFPLVTLQLPILGNQDVSGYDLLSKAKGVNQALDAIKSKQREESVAESVQPTPYDSTTKGANSSMPLSIQALPLIPIEIIVGFICALISLLCCLGPFGSAPTKAFSTIGCVAAVAAIVHLTVANSDLHTWFRELINADSSAFANNPFGGLAQQIENLAANSVQLRPGAGLYVLAASISLGVIILFSKVLSVVPSAEAAIETYPESSNSRARTVGFLFIFIIAIAIVIIVLIHKPPTASSTHDVTQPSRSASKGFDIFKWPKVGLPDEIANALDTPDLASGTRTEVTLGESGERQFILVNTDPSFCGSAGCSWDLFDATTNRKLIEGELGELLRTKHVTEGYYDLLVSGKLSLVLYQYHDGSYHKVQCYGRSDGIGSPAILESCQ